MSKRPHEEVEAAPEAAAAEEKPLKKHTLDSDEEDEIDSKKYNLMDPEEIEGEEEDTITKDGDIQITPFNMKEEMTEGHFDAEGNYYWKKEVEIRDAWLDNIDDAKQHFDPRGGKEDSDDDSSDGEPESVKESDRAATYEQMLELMQPKETVAKALRRLGGNKSRHSASARWKQKRAAVAAGGSSEPDKAAEDKQNMERLTGLADRLLSQGNMEVYQMTREAVNHQLEKIRKPVAERLKGAATEDDALDMFGDSLDKQPSASGDGKPADAAAPAPEASDSGAPAADSGQADSESKKSEPAPASNGKPEADGDSAAMDSGDAVMWEFKWDDSADAEVHGPHTSSEMHAWSESGYFSDAVQVRKTGSDAFYQVKRVDFELYI